jgi:hypothetical protein
MEFAMREQPRHLPGRDQLVTTKITAHILITAPALHVAARTLRARGDSHLLLARLSTEFSIIVRYAS